jgi:hypothetical protein
VLSFSDVASAKRRSLPLRAALRAALRAGAPEEARRLLSEEAPHVLAYPPHAALVGLHLACERVLAAAARGDAAGAAEAVRSEIAPFEAAEEEEEQEHGEGDCESDVELEGGGAAQAPYVLLSSAPALVVRAHRALALAAGRAALAQLRGHVDDVVALTAYAQPASRSCPLCHLLAPAARDAAADVLSAAVLEHEIATLVQRSPLRTRNASRRFGDEVSTRRPMR